MAPGRKTMKNPYRYNHRTGVIGAHPASASGFRRHPPAMPTLPFFDRNPMSTAAALL
jgi:hypothetical protein